MVSELLDQLRTRQGKESAESSSGMTTSSWILSINSWSCCGICAVGLDRSGPVLHCILAVGLSY